MLTCVSPNITSIAREICSFCSGKHGIEIISPALQFLAPNLVSRRNLKGCWLCWCLKLQCDTTHGDVTASRQWTRDSVCSGGTLLCARTWFASIKIAESCSSYSSLWEAKPDDPMNCSPNDSPLSFSPKCKEESRPNMYSVGFKARY